MPMTRITVQEGRSAAELHQVQDILHQTLVNEFDVPAADRFQIVDIKPAEQLHYDPHYMTGERSSRFTLFEITAGKPRRLEQKQALYHTLTQRLVATLGMRPDDVMIVIRFTATEDWCFGLGKGLTGDPQ